MRMKPLFLIVCAFSLAWMAYTFVIGWNYHYGMARIEQQVEETGQPVTQEEYDEVGGLVGRHFIFGMLTGIIVSAVHSLVLVYFVGTGKAIKEQMETQNWGEDEYNESKKYMGQAIVPTALGIIAIILASFSGGFALIQTIHPDAHMVIALAGTFGQIPIYAREYVIIGRNGKLMDRVVDRLGGEDVRVAL